MVVVVVGVVVVAAAVVRGGRVATGDASSASPGVVVGPGAASVHALATSTSPNSGRVRRTRRRRVITARRLPPVVAWAALSPGSLRSRPDRHRDRDIATRFCEPGSSLPFDGLAASTTIGAVAIPTPSSTVNTTPCFVARVRDAVTASGVGHR